SDVRSVLFAPWTKYLSIRGQGWSHGSHNLQVGPVLTLFRIRNKVRHDRHHMLRPALECVLLLLGVVIMIVMCGDTAVDVIHDSVCDKSAHLQVACHCGKHGSSEVVCCPIGYARRLLYLDERSLQFL